MEVRGRKLETQSWTLCLPLSMMTSSFYSLASKCPAELNVILPELILQRSGPIYIPISMENLQVYIEREWGGGGLGGKRDREKDRENERQRGRETEKCPVGQIYPLNITCVQYKISFFSFCHSCCCF